MEFRIPNSEFCRPISPFPPNSQFLPFPLLPFPLSPFPNLSAIVHPCVPSHSTCQATKMFFESAMSRRRISVRRTYEFASPPQGSTEQTSYNARGTIPRRRVLRRFSGSSVRERSPRSALMSPISLREIGSWPFYRRRVRRGGRGAGAVRHEESGKTFRHRGGRPARSLSHRLSQPLSYRWAETGWSGADPRRQRWRGDGGDSARDGLRVAGVRHRRFRRTVPALPRPRRLRELSTTTMTRGPPKPWKPPTASAPTSCSTASAPHTSGKTSRCSLSAATWW